MGRSYLRSRRQTTPASNRLAKKCRIVADCAWVEPGSDPSRVRFPPSMPHHLDHPVTRPSGSCLELSSTRRNSARRLDSNRSISRRVEPMERSTALFAE
jgi:hypothetical protein